MEANLTVISQPRYLPALNYLQRLYFADTFILLDTVQRQARGWENRNKLFVDKQPSWVSIPIKSSSRELIKDTCISNAEWTDDHCSKITQNYKDSPFFDADFITHCYSSIKHALEQNQFDFTTAMTELYRVTFGYLGLTFNIVRASELEQGAENIPPKGPEKLLWLCQKNNSSKYISGPNGAEYGIAEVFDAQNMLFAYHTYPPTAYAQSQSQTFEPYLGYFDALFNMGPEWLKAHIQEEPTIHQ
jgi:hypothetical protein